MCLIWLAEFLLWRPNVNVCVGMKSSFVPISCFIELVWLTGVFLEDGDRVSEGKLGMKIFKTMYLLWEVKVKIAQSSPTLCNPMDYTVNGILQTRILEWVAFPFPRGSSQPRDQTQVSCIADKFFTTELSGKPLWEVSMIQGWGLQKSFLWLISNYFWFIHYF